MPYVRIWVHLVWSTKNRFPFMDGELRRKICIHLAENAVSKNIHLDCINGSADHLHALISLGSDQTVAKIAQLLKGESSHWVNKEIPRRLKFEWQDDYFAESVSWSALSAVQRYIADQEEHHRRKSFAEEVAEFLARHGLTGSNQSLFNDLAPTLRSGQDPKTEEKGFNP